MNEKEKITKSETSTYKEISYSVKTIPQNKYIISRIRIGFSILSIIFIIAESIFALSFNPLFFFLSLFKITLAFSPLLFMVYLAIGTPDAFKKWQKKSTRKNEIISRLLHLFKDVGVILIIPLVIFGLIHLSGLPRYIEANFLEENPGLEFPLNYHPTISELLLIISIIILLLVTHFTMNYWLSLRCTQYIGYNEEKKILKINLKRVLTAFSINAMIFGAFLTFILDDLFVSTKFPDIMASWDKYDTVFASNPEIILVIELVIIILLNIFYIVDGLLANRFRTNFVVEAINESLVE